MKELAIPGQENLLKSTRENILFLREILSVSDIPASSLTQKRSRSDDSTSTAKDPPAESSGIALLEKVTTLEDHKSYNRTLCP